MQSPPVVGSTDRSHRRSLPIARSGLRRFRAPCAGKRLDGQLVEQGCAVDQPLRAVDEPLHAVDFPLGAVDEPLDADLRPCVSRSLSLTQRSFVSGR